MTNLTCKNCIYFTGEAVLPCSINPYNFEGKENIYDAEICRDFELTSKEVVSPLQEIYNYLINHNFVVDGDLKSIYFYLENDKRLRFIISIDDDNDIELELLFNNYMSQDKYFFEVSESQKLKTTIQKAISLAKID